MNNLSKTTLQMLRDTHNQYCDFKQAECSDDHLCVQLEHPQAELYKTYRAFFDSLKYCCNSNARRVAYRNKDNHVEYWAPSLATAVSYYNDLDEFPTQVYPAMGEQWEQFLRKLAKLNWPKKYITYPHGLHSGAWHITTTDTKLTTLLKQLSQEHGCVSQKHYGGDGHFCIRSPSPDLWNTVHQLVQRFFAQGCLPARTAEDNRQDTRALPLAEKWFCHANVREVTETDRAIQVPLVPFGNRQRIIEVAEDLLRVVDQGYPWLSVASWMEAMLTKESFTSLQQRYHGRD